MSEAADRPGASTPRYAGLNEHAQRIVDPRAEVMAAKLKIAVEEAREVIASRVVTKTNRTTHGTGH